MSKIVVVIPNWNGADRLCECLDSLQEQTVAARIILVDNGSRDDSIALVEKHYPKVEIIRHNKNKGYAGGVNPGFKRAIELGCDYVAPFNNDAVADKNWLKELAESLEAHPKTGIATCKILHSDGKSLDSTGDYYTVWGLPYPRGRDETDTHAYDEQTDIFGASGGASMYRVQMLAEIGLFDEDFFAYYEDVDLSFRAQLSGWKVLYVPSAKVYHAIGGTSGGLRGFTTYQTLKNLPLLWIKNVPRRFLWRIGWRLALAQFFFFGRALTRGLGWYALKGSGRAALLMGKKLGERRRIQAGREVSDDYIWDIVVHDLPPNARNLRLFRRVRHGFRRRP